MSKTTRKQKRSLKKKSSVKSKSQKNTLVFNVGSSSVKYAFFKGTAVVDSGNTERITSTIKRQQVIRRIAHSFQERNLIPNTIAHRVVHGGTYTKTMKLTPATIKGITKVAELAPLHDIPELDVIDFCKSEFGVDQYAVFDTAFHQTIPPEFHMYAIPKRFYLKGIRKYGFHGISHEYVSRGFKGKVITCHLGSGASICAIKNGKSVETSMGFTPLDGLIMGTRSGSIGAGVIPYLSHHEKLSVSQIEQVLNKESGLLAIGGSNDVRDLRKSKTKNAKLAINMYVNRIVETIGAYVAVLGGIDTIIFTAGTGQRSAPIRRMICKKLEYLGIKLDSAQNRKAVDIKLKISDSKSKVKVYVVPTNEELAIVEKVLALRKS